MAFTLAPIAVLQFSDDVGQPLAGGLLATYAAGTSTPLGTAKDSVGTANTNPIVLDAGGRATIYLTAGLSYSFVLTTALGVLVWAQDHIAAVPSSDPLAGNIVIGGTLTVAGAVILNNNLAVAGTLSSGGTATLNAAVVSTTLTVSGTATLASIAGPAVITSSADADATNLSVFNSGFTTSGRKLSILFGKAASSGDAGVLQFQYHAAIPTARIVALGLFGDDPITTGAGLQVFKGGNVGINTTTPANTALSIGGGTTRSGTQPTNAIDLYNGTAPVGTLTNGCTLYVTAGELRVMDAGGTATLLSPHDHTPNWVFLSENHVTGKRVRIEVEQLLRRLNAHFGEPEWVQA